MITIVRPKGSFGSDFLDTRIEIFLRAFAEKYKQYDGEWAEKYGTEYSDEKVIMKPFCWCEKPQCPYCFDVDFEPSEELIKKYGIDKDEDDCMVAPNFWYKPIDFKVWWYKYIGRSTHCNKSISESEFNDMCKNLNIIA